MQTAITCELSPGFLPNYSCLTMLSPANPSLYWCWVPPVCLAQHGICCVTHTLMPLSSGFVPWVLKHPSPSWNGMATARHRHTIFQSKYLLAALSWPVSSQSPFPRIEEVRKRRQSQTGHISPPDCSSLLLLINWNATHPLEGCFLYTSMKEAV